MSGVVPPRAAVCINATEGDSFCLPSTEVTEKPRVTVQSKVLGNLSAIFIKLVRVFVA